MSRERSNSLTPKRKIKQRTHGLRMQTLPLSSDLKSSESVRTTRDLEDDQDDEYGRNNPQSSFEKDEDFKFKRHKAKNGGSASLGERLDNLQELERARWMENFNSSVNVERQRDKSSAESSQRMMHMSGPPMPQSYMPYMYYYPMPPMMPINTSPTRLPGSQENDVSHYINSSQGHPNTSTQPFLPHMPPPNSQLMPPPPLYPNYSPYNYYQNSDIEPSRKVQQRREKRKSLMAQRGRRLSMLSFQDNSHIISPHKDVPEEDFYRHIANNSFGHDLQMRQLFNWCFIRSLRKRESADIHQDKEANGSDDSYVDPKRITMVIMKEFVNELRKGKIEIDWETPDSQPKSEQRSDYEEEDTELRELFDDFEDNTGQQKIRKSKKSIAIKIPNEKNLQNQKSNNAAGADRWFENEIKAWVQKLDEDGQQSEWSTFKSELENCSKEASADTVTEPSSTHLEHQLASRMDRFYSMAHFLNSYSKILSRTSDQKLRKLNRCINDTEIAIVPGCDRRKTTRELLQGLSKTLIE